MSANITVPIIDLDENDNVILKGRTELGNDLRGYLVPVYIGSTIDEADSVAHAYAPRRLIGASVATSKFLPFTDDLVSMLREMHEAEEAAKQACMLPLEHDPDADVGGAA